MCIRDRVLADVLANYAALDDQAVQTQGRNARDWVVEAYSADTHVDRVAQVLGELGMKGLGAH